jgi:hypothetical protein
MQLVGLRKRRRRSGSETRAIPAGPTSGLTFRPESYLVHRAMCGFFTFEWSSQLTRMVFINFANDIVMYYKFAKSTTVRENESIGDNSMSDRVYIFDTTLRDGEQSPGFRDKLHHFF